MRCGCLHVPLLTGKKHEKHKKHHKVREKKDHKFLISHKCSVDDLWTLGWRSWSANRRRSWTICLSPTCYPCPRRPGRQIDLPILARGLISCLSSPSLKRPPTTSNNNKWSQPWILNCEKCVSPSISSIVSETVSRWPSAICATDGVGPRPSTCLDKMLTDPRKEGQGTSNLHL